MTQPNQPDSVEEMAKKLRTRIFTSKTHQQMFEILVEAITQAKAEERESNATALEALKKDGKMYKGTLSEEDYIKNETLQQAADHLRSTR